MSVYASVIVQEREEEGREGGGGRWGKGGTDKRWEERVNEYLGASVYVQLWVHINLFVNSLLVFPTSMSRIADISIKYNHTTPGKVQLKL